MSDSVRPHRWQPTRLPRPWDSPGKNTGVGCHFPLQCIKVKSKSEVTQSCPTLSGPHGLQPTRLLRLWDFPGKSTGVGCHCLLRWMFIHSHKNQCTTTWKLGIQTTGQINTCWSRICNIETRIICERKGDEPIPNNESLKQCSKEQRTQKLSSYT